MYCYSFWCVFLLCLFCISIVFVRWLYPGVHCPPSTIPGSGGAWQSPTQTSAHLGPPNPVNPLPQPPGALLTSSGPPNQAIGPPGPVQPPEGPQTVVSGPPAACVCPYVGGQPPILNLLPLRYLLTFINFVTQPPKGRPLVDLHLGSSFSLCLWPDFNLSAFYLWPLPGCLLVSKVRRVVAFVEILLRQNTCWLALSPAAYKDSIDATLIVCRGRGRPPL